MFIAHLQQYDQSGWNTTMVGIPKTNENQIFGTRIKRKIHHLFLEKNFCHKFLVDLLKCPQPP